VTQLGESSSALTEQTDSAVSPSVPPTLNNTSAFIYGLPFLVHNIALTPLVTFVPALYSSPEHGLPMAMVGTILLVSRLTDVVTDPIVGELSDRTRTRWGRRKPWILCGLPLMMLSVMMVFAPVGKVTPLYAFIWLSMIYLAFTIVDLPYKAWGAELSQSYDGRSRIAAWREGFGMFSGLLALLIILGATRGLGMTTADTMLYMGVIFASCMPVLFGLAMWKVPEAPISQTTRAHVPWREGLAAVWANKAYLRLMLAVLFLIGGAIIGASLHLIVMERVFNIRSWFALILLGEGIIGILSVPFWLRLSKRYGKHRAMAIATAWLAIWCLPIPFLGPGDGYWYAAIIVIRGFQGGAGSILIPSMVADTVDIDTLRTGQSRAGIYYAWTGAIMKLGVGLGAFVGTSLPALFGFENANLTNTASAQFALLVTYAWVPMVIMLLATPFFWTYPLTEEKQRETRKKIDEAQAAINNKHTVPMQRSDL
jgi:glycoside/pentoside/hexuronide:cation symporter, GPH family